jgi:hypothetical protein
MTYGTPTLPGGVRRSLPAVLLGPVLAAGFVLATLGCGGHRTQVIAPSGTPGWLQAAATTAAAALGDEHPSVIHVFLGTSDRVVMHGRFHCPQCSRPSNAAAVQEGTVVVLRFDSRTHKQTDFGVGDFTGPDRTIT